MMTRIPFPTRRMLAALAMAVLAAAALPVLAQDADLADDGPAIHGMAARAGDDDVADVADVEPGFPARLARRLDLTDAQQDAIAKILEAGRARDLPLRKQVRQLRHDLQGEMMKDEPSEKAVLALAKQAGDLRSQLQVGRLQDRLAVRRLLTAEQRDKLEMFGGPGRGFGPGFGPRGPFMGAGPGRFGRHGGEGMIGRQDGGRREHRRQADRNSD